MNIVLPDGSKKELQEGATVYDVAASIGAGLAKAAVAGKVNGEIVDTSRVVSEGDAVEIITDKSPEALGILRHSTAHVMAEAVQILFPGAQIAYGPETEDGFYYDFELPRPLSSDDFATIEKKMTEIVAMDEPFIREEVTREEALEIFKDQRLKTEHINELADDGTQLSIYRHGSFVDLCKGPHIPSARFIGAFKMMKLAGAYWKADASREQLQRLYGTAFFKKKDLEEYLHVLEEAEKRDHRKIGREMELFMMADEGPGFPFWLPNGTKLKNALIDYWHEMMATYDYDEVETPTILSSELWKTSGHWDHYKDNMYTTMIDDEVFAVKPMNCPGACLIFKSKPRSYRELPLKLAEAGHDHRHEIKGALHGLFRVRAFTQDDGHIFITPEQISDTVLETVRLFDEYYHQFGFEYKVELSTRPEDSMGSDEDWERAESGLREALDKIGIDYVLNEGDGAFYGPKIDFHLKDCLNRTWQCGTIQLDFQLPQNFELEYTAADGSKQRPIMIHRAGFGSFERFIGMLIEQYAGKFPTWLSPLQVKVLPVSEKSAEYAHGVYQALKKEGIRVAIDERGETIGYKIREARQIDRVPYMLILGEKEAEAGNISVRSRATDKTQSCQLDEFISQLKEEIKARS